MNQHFVDSGKERSVSCLAAFVRFEVTELSYSVIYVPLFMHLFKRYAFCLPGRGVNDVHQCLYIKSCTWISSVVLLLLLHCFHLIFLYYYTLAIALSLFSWQFSFCNFRKESFMKNSHSGENCPTHTVCHSNGHAFIWFCQKLQYRCRFFFLRRSFSTSLLQCSDLRKQQSKTSTCYKQTVTFTGN